MTEQSKIKNPWYIPHGQGSSIYFTFNTDKFIAYRNAKIYEGLSWSFVVINVVRVMCTRKGKVK